MGGRPVVFLGRDDEDVPVEAQLLAVVLADVRVIPVGARIGHVHLVREGLPDRDRRLRLVGAVVAVLEAEPVPVHGRIDVPAVGDVDDDRRALGHLEGRPRNRSVVGEHAHGRIPDLLLDRRDLELELVAIGEFNDLGAADVGQSLRRAWHFDGVRVPVGMVVVHA